jgi:hypothetical protein
MIRLIFIFKDNGLVFPIVKIAISCIVELVNNFKLGKQPKKMEAVLV